MLPSKFRSLVKIAKNYSTESGSGKKRWKYIIGGSLGTIIVIGYGTKLYFNSRTSQINTTITDGEKQRVVVLGSGWASLSFISDVDTDKYDVTVVSPQNYFLFTPLLPGVATSSLEFNSIIEPIRKYCQRTNSEKIHFFEATCVDIDPTNNSVSCQVNQAGINKTFPIPYDQLVVACGAINQTFGIKGVEENCNFLKSLPDAMAIRKKIIDSFETASLEATTEEEKKRLLNFVVVGGGPAGTEFAAELRDYIDHDLKRWYPTVAKYANVSIIELLGHILNTYNKEISQYVEKTFASRKIDVKVNSRVVGVGKNIITVVDSQNKQEEIPFGLAVWTTGIGTSSLVTKLREKIPAQTNRRALLTDHRLKVKGSSNIYAMGDCSTVEQDLMLSKMEEIFKLGDSDGDGLLNISEFKSIIHKQSTKYPQLEFFGDKVEEMFHKHDVNKDQALSIEEFRDLVKIVDSKCTSLPPTAQVATQEGRYLATLFNKMDVTKQETQDAFPPFKYHHLFSIANIGDKKAVIDAGKYSISGLGAWYLWKSVYLSKQYSFHNKLAIAGNWINTSLFGRNITRE